MKKPNFYCQKICGELEFSIKEWNETEKALELTNLTESEKQEILFPKGCNKQCFTCLCIVAERQAKTNKFNKNRQTLNHASRI